VHGATLHVLKETGVDVRSPRALEIFERGGGHVDGIRVRLESSMIERAIASVPKGWKVPWRGSAMALHLNGEDSYFGTGSDCPYICDPDSGARRRAVTSDIEGMAALCEKLPHIDFVMSMGLPADVPESIDDVAQMAAMLRGTRKPIMICPKDGSTLGRLVEMAATCGAWDSFIVYAMPSPPLMHDSMGATKLIACAELNLPIVYAPSPCAGTTAPASTVSTIVVGNAEVLSGLVLHQLVTPGAPFVYGAGVDVMDMREIVPSYALPEVFLGNAAACDLARHYGLPSFAYAADSDSKLLDEQWAAEAAITAILGGLSRATLLHDVGYLETGMQSSYETIVLADELLGFARALMTDLSVDEESLAVDEIIAVGPGGNHLGRAYTRGHYRDFWRPELFDHAIFERWHAQGAKTLKERVKAKTDRLRAEDRAFVLERDAQERLSHLLAEELAARGGPGA
jgi:trimethylamine--corrinoid protein Co-methyltransferase